MINKKTTCCYHQLHVVVSPGIWQQKIDQIGLLRLYKLGKEYLDI